MSAFHELCHLFIQGNQLPVTIFSADFFTFNRYVFIFCCLPLSLIGFFFRQLPVIDSIWDRGGLVAIDIADREKFVSVHRFLLRKISVRLYRYRDALLRMMKSGHTRLYVVAMYYDDPEFTGPPNCLSDDHIAQLFGKFLFSSADVD